MAKTKAQIQNEYYHRTGAEKQKEYEAQNTRFIGLKLNKKTDNDILQALEGKPMQTEIKRLIRIALKNENKE